MRSGFFVFEKVKIPSREATCYGPPVNPGTRSELREHLDARLNDGVDAEDFLIIRGREEKITGVKVVAEFETPET